MRRRTLFLCFATIAFVMVAMPVLVVRAHADYERSDPPADAQLEEAPDQVQVWFNQELFRREDSNWLEVYGPSGERVDLGDAAIDDDDRTLITVSLSPDLPDGVYTVRWHTLSADDGHEGDGEFHFTVEEAGDVSPAPDTVTGTDATDPANEADGTTPADQAETPVAEPAPAPAESSGGLPCVGGTALIGFALGAVLVGRRRHSIR